MSNFDRLAWQREYRKKNKNSCTISYERTKKGKIMRTYRNMKSRVSGVLSKKSHLYEGLDLLQKEEFYDWSLNDSSFNNLYEDWVASGYSRKLSPSIDRLDTSKGYTADNIRWITQSDNSSDGGKWSIKNG